MIYSNIITLSDSEVSLLFDIHELIQRMEKAGEKDVKIRTIHYYAGKDLLKPIGFGRNAKYDMMHVHKYRLIRMLQRKHYSLQQIRDELTSYENVDTLLVALDRHGPIPQSLDTSEKLDNQHEQFDDLSFWAKLDKFAVSAGAKVSYCVLLLYFLLVSDSSSKYEKISIIGALSYFVMTNDAVPDFLPGLGFVDDLGALSLVLRSVRNQLSQEIHVLAEEKLNNWFASYRSVTKEMDEIKNMMKGSDE
jgi:uncharacterized membrane protein YkvA (DUF1232 family)